MLISDIKTKLLGGITLNINEELSKYSGPQDFSSKSNKKVYKDSNIIDDVTYSIKDDN